MIKYVRRLAQAWKLLRVVNSDKEISPKMKKRLGKLYRAILEVQNDVAVATPGMNENYVFNFRKQFVNNNIVTMNNAGVAEFTLNGAAVTPIGYGQANLAPAPGTKGVIAVTVKPVDVVSELHVKPNPVSLAALDEKIALLKDKAELVNQHYTKKEIEGYIQRLEWRKRYLEFETFFRSFDDTTEEAVEALLGKYNGLAMFDHDLFVPELPEVAIKIMTEYTRIAKEITGKKPVFYIIAPKEEFKKRQERRDPILLAQSLFGFYYQILGAWDKEMVLLNEL